MDEDLWEGAGHCGAGGDPRRRLSHAEDRQMRTVAQYLLSLIFIAQMYLAMLVLAVWWTPFVLFRRDAAFDAVHS